MTAKSLFITSGGSSNGFDVFGYELTSASASRSIACYGLEGGVAALKEGQHIFTDMREIFWRSALRTGEPFPEFSRAAGVVKDEDLPALAGAIAAEGFSFLHVAGGDGSLKMYGKWLPSLRENRIRSSFIPGTIDGDIPPWKSKCLGTSTAEDGAQKAARSFLTNHMSDDGARMFLAECMGRNNGTIALAATQGAGMFGFLLPEEIVHVPDYAVILRNELGVENPEEVSTSDLVTYLALSHLKVHCTALNRRQRRFTFIIGEGVCLKLKTTIEEVGEEVSKLLRLWGVKQSVHYKVSPETIGYGAVRIIPSNSTDCRLASEYAWGIVEAFSENPEMEDVLIVPGNNGGFVAKTHHQVFGDAVSSGTTKLDLKNNKIYLRKARARGERLLFSFDLDEPQVYLDQMFALAPELSRDEFEKLVKTVAYLGDTKKF